MKKLISLILIICMILSTVLIAFAGGGGSGTGDVILIRKIGSYDFAVFTTEATAAAGSVSFGTHGWTIEYSGQQFLYTVPYNPNTSISYSIPLVDGSGSSSESFQSRIRNVKGEASSEYAKFMELCKNGGEIVFQAYIQRYDNKMPTGRYASTLNTALHLADDAGGWGENTVAEFNTQYYNRHATVNPQPINKVHPDFDIKYKGNIVNDNQSNPSVKDSSNLQLKLEDKSTVDLPSDYITFRKWYYWDIQSGFKMLTTAMSGISISTDGKEVTINNCDANLPGSAVMSKGLKLEVTTLAGVKGAANKNTYFVSPPPPPPPPGTADIFIYYLDKLTKLDVYPADETTYKNKPYGTYSIEAKPAPDGYSLDSSTPTPKTVTVDEANNFVKVTFYYIPQSTGSGGKPPTAVITGPGRRMAGESITFSGGSSFDPDGTIVNYIWNIPGSNHIYTEPSGKATRVWYPHEGEYDLDLTVVDDSGMTGDCMTTIEITPPVPTAVIDITGKLKENRKITVSGSNSSSPTYYPINKYTWTMTNQSDARYAGSFGGDASKDMILKKAQSYRFDLKVNNTYGLSDTESKTITIDPDVAPIADFSVATQVLRNPNDSNYATITATNLSKSTDGDPIKKTVMFYAYDSDNDGNFDEETWYICKNGTAWAASGLTYAQLNSLDLYNLAGASNPASFVLKTQNVGKYKFEAKTIEDIPAADTIPSLLTAADYKTGITTATKPNSAKIVEVINTAPTVSFEVRKKKPADIFIFTDYTGDKLNGLQSAIAAKKAQLSALGVDAGFVIVNSSKNVGSKTVNIYKFRRDSGMAFHKVEAWGPYGDSDNGIEYQLAFTDEIETYDQNPLDMPAGKLAVSYGGGTYYDTSDKNPSYYSQGYRYTVYDNQGGSYPVSFATYRVQGAYHWEVRDWHIEGVYNGNWIRDSGIIRTDTYNATSIDLDKILTQTLRSGSDRYAFFLSDASSFDYSQSFGSTFAFGSLTDTINNYIKSNGFKVSVIASPAAVDNNLICEKVTDIVSTGCYGFYTTPDGKTKSLGTLYPKTSGEPVYPYDRGTNFGKIREGYTYADYNYVYNYLIMQNGTVKKQSGQSDVFTTIPGLTGIVKKIGPYFLKANGDCYAENGRLIATGISAVGNDKPMHIQFNKNSVYYEYDILLCSNGTMIAVSPDYTTTYPVYYEYYTYDASGYYTGGPYYTTVSGVKDITDRFFIRTNGDVIPKMGVTYYNNKIMFHEGFHPNYYTRPGRSNIATGVSSIKENGNIVIFTMANGNKKMAFYGRTYRYSGGEFRDWVYTMSPVTDLDVVSGYSKDSLWENGTSLNYMLTADGNLRRYEAAVTSLSGLLNAPVILSNVRYYDGLIAITNDDKVYSAIGTTVKLLSISNVDKVVTKEYFAAGTSNSTGQLISYILTKDNTLYAFGYSNYGQTGFIQSYLGSASDAVIPNSPKITLNQPGLNYLTLRDVLNASPGNRYYAAGQYSQALTDLAASYTSDPSYSTNYILVGDTVDYKVIYQDFELDPDYRYYWTYDHQSNYFENSLGLASFHGQTLSTPVTTFDKVGKYTINLKVRDNPKNNDLFDNYRLYNQGVVTATLYVHRLGVPALKPVITPNGEYWRVEAVDAGSYDLDHLSRADKGIVAREWRWKSEYETAWHNERMVKADCLPTEAYQIQLRVKDVEGFWSDWKEIVIKNGNPPVAEFRIDNMLMKLDDTLKVLDQSYVQSFSVLSDWHWIVRKLSTGGTMPGTEVQNAKFTNSNNGTGALAGYDANVKTRYDTNGAGSYRVFLRVRDSSGMWSDGGNDSLTPVDLSKYHSKDFTVDRLPIASFTIQGSVLKPADTLRLTDNSYTNGVSPVVKWHWIVKKLNPNGSIPGTDLQNAQFANRNAGTGTMTGYDVNVKTKYDDTGPGTYRIYLRVMNGNGMWSDNGTDSTVNLGSCASRDIVVDTPPTASFTIEKNPIEPTELLRLRDTSAITGVSPIDRWHWIVKKLKEDGSVPEAELQNRQYTDSNNGTGELAGYDKNVMTDYSKEGAGAYKIYLRVRNSSGMWSDGGTDTAYNLNSFFAQELNVKESCGLSGFRITRIRDVQLEGYYYNTAEGKYIQRVDFVNSMAVDNRNFGHEIKGLTKGYVFEFEIDSRSFNDDTDYIQITPGFFTCDDLVRDPEERELYWENSRHEILKAGEGGHSPWASVRLTKDDRTITSEKDATWRGSYLIPGTAWAVPYGTSNAHSREKRIERDIIVNFEIKGYKNGEMKYDYNLKQWPEERTTPKPPYEIGDVIRYDYSRSNLDDINVIINRP